MINKLKILTKLIEKGDIRFYLYQKYSLLAGNLSTNISRIFYGKRLEIETPFNIWDTIHSIIFMKV